MLVDAFERAARFPIFGSQVGQGGPVPGGTFPVSSRLQVCCLRGSEAGFIVITFVFGAVIDEAHLLLLCLRTPHRSRFLHDLRTGAKHDQVDLHGTLQSTEE